MRIKDSLASSKDILTALGINNLRISFDGRFAKPEVLSLVGVLNVTESDLATDGKKLQGQRSDLDLNKVTIPSLINVDKEKSKIQFALGAGQKGSIRYASISGSVLDIAFVDSNEADIVEAAILKLNPKIEDKTGFRLLRDERQIEPGRAIPFFNVKLVNHSSPA